MWWNMVALGMSISSYGHRPLNWTWRHGPFLKSTGDLSHRDMRQGAEIDSAGLPHVREKSGKSCFFQGQGNVREF